MSAQIYIAILILVLAVIAVFGKKDKQGKKLTPLAGLAFGCILVGIIFNGNRAVGYSFLGAGVIVAIIDMIKKS